MKLPDFFQRSHVGSGDFWEWFVKNEADIRAVKTGQEKIMDTLGRRIRAQGPGLQFEMSTQKEGDREFIVSAGGIRDVIPDVEALVREAPPIPGWKVIAFRQRHPGFTLTLGSTHFGPEDIWFSATTHSEHVDLDLYIKGYNGNNKMAMQAAFLMLDATLGEYDVMTKVGQIDFHHLPDDPAAQGLKPSNELAAIIDAL
jgi:hypothetical protein